MPSFVAGFIHYGVAISCVNPSKLQRAPPADATGCVMAEHGAHMPRSRLESRVLAPCSDQTYFRQNNPFVKLFTHCYCYTSALVDLQMSIVVCKYSTWHWFLFPTGLCSGIHCCLSRPGLLGKKKICFLSQWDFFWRNKVSI